ncbi:YHS domain-containing (seleno)protein [Ruegeria sp. Ofav3-42]|uniref:YHS domain-containing (seleno)protein n=1 Tax=Ruegeria sp. Ofav3-42 TaxID=2917759 RepID=UPI001EF635D5|nr:YHS domain-containing (seleno)protein [Ruegeria sp. Ofav3-42]MCG7519222.1 YHS domain protein [Ruegeria sp. Ofav3-42]
MPTRRFILGAIAAAAFLPAAHAQDMPVYFETDGAVMAGYDPVSYFSGGIPVQGLPEYSVIWKGAEWHFASAENRDLFESNPRAYAPQFGGYCAYAMAQGELISTDPMLWDVVDGRLYLTHSPEIERLWNDDRAEYIQMAEEHWPVVLYHQ